MSQLPPGFEIISGGQPAQPAPRPQSPPPFIPGTPNPTKQAAEARAQQDQALQIEAGRRAAEAADRARKEWNAKYNPDGTLRPGQGDAKPTEFQSKSASFLGRLLQAEQLYGQVEPGSRDARTAFGQVFHDTFPSLDATLNSSQRVTADNAARNFIAASLRQESGAAIGKEEYDNQYRIFFPMPGDTPDQIEQKRLARLQAIEGFKISAGPLAQQAIDSVQKSSVSPIGQDANRQAPPPIPGDTGQQSGVRRYYDENGNIVNEEDVGPATGNDPGYKQIAAGVGDAVQAVGDLLGIVGNPLNATINAAFDTNLSTDLGGTLRDMSGLPQNDPTISAINRGAFGALFGGGGANVLARQLAPSLFRNALVQYGATPVTDAFIGGGAAGAGEAAKSVGAGPGGQAGAMLAGGLVPAVIASRYGRISPNMTPRGPAPTNPNEIVRAGQDWNVPVFTSDVVPPTTVGGKSARLLGESIPFAGTGGGMGGRATQQTAREEATKRFVQELGGAPTSLDEITKDFVETRGQQLTNLTKAKDSVIDATQQPIQPIQLRGTLREIDTQIAKLNRANPEAFAPVIAKLQSFRDVLSSGKTLREVEMNRRLLGDLFDDPNLANIRGDGQKAINAIYDPLRKDMGDIIESTLGGSARAKWQKANDKLASMASELGDSKFKAVLNRADTRPEQVASLLFSKTPSEARRLFENLSDTGKIKARAAIIHEAATKATDNEVISVDRFKQGLKAMENSVGVFFSPADKVRIDGFVRLLEATQRAKTATTEVMTGARNTAFVGGITLAQVFGNWTIPAGATIGLLARAYESAPFRDMILKLSKTKPGTQAEAVIGKRISDYLSRATVPQLPANDLGSIVTKSATAASAEDPKQ